MSKIYLNRMPRKGPWGGGSRFVNAFYEYFNDKSLSSSHSLCDPSDALAKPDVILIVGLEAEYPCIGIEQAVAYKRMFNPAVKIIVRVNENDARKNTSSVDDTFLRVSEHVDKTVFVSHWLRDYFLSKGWKCKDNTVILNGVDAKVFKPIDEKLNNGKINIVTHHWSNNYLKGFDFYDQLDSFINENSNFTFTYIGRERGTFSKKTTVVKPLNGDALAKELGKHDVYVSASRADPGPNHICESISSGLPTYVHIDGGGCVEFAGSDHVYRDWEGLKALLVKGKFTANNTSFESWTDCVNRYISFIEVP